MFLFFVLKLKFYILLNRKVKQLLSCVCVCVFNSWTQDQDSEEGKATKGLWSLLFE